MEAKDRIIVALDVDSAGEALSLVKCLQDEVGAFKVGFELIYSMLVALVSEVAFESIAAHRDMNELFSMLSGRVFMDVKFKDIPNTVAKASKTITRLNPKMFSLHADGGPKMMLAAREAVDESDFGHVPIIAVTLLTSLDFAQMRQMGLLYDIPQSVVLADDDQMIEARQNLIGDYVVNKARMAQDNGMDGVVASAREAISIRRACGSDFLIVTPAVRPTWSPAEDQARPTTPKEAVDAGSDYQVIGRSIINPPAEIGTPFNATRLIVAEITTALKVRLTGKK